MHGSAGMKNVSNFYRFLILLVQTSPPTELICAVS